MLDFDGEHPSYYFYYHYYCSYYYYYYYECYISIAISIITNTCSAIITNTCIIIVCHYRHHYDYYD